MNVYCVYQPLEYSEYLAIEVTATDSIEDIRDRLADANFYFLYAKNSEQAILKTISLGKGKYLKKDSEIK